MFTGDLAYIAVLPAQRHNRLAVFLIVHYKLLIQDDKIPWCVSTDGLLSSTCMATSGVS